MSELKVILEKDLPIRELKMGGDFCFLSKRGLKKIESPLLEKHTGLDFWIGYFFTGLPKYSIVPLIIGFDQHGGSYEFFCDPLFSSRYNGVERTFNRIRPKEDYTKIKVELLELYKMLGTKIRENGNLRYQILFMDNTWRVLTFGSSKRIKIVTTPNNLYKPWSLKSIAQAVKKICRFRATAHIV